MSEQYWCVEANRLIAGCRVEQPDDVSEAIDLVKMYKKQHFCNSDTVYIVRGEVVAVMDYKQPAPHWDIRRPLEDE